MGEIRKMLMAFLLGDKEKMREKKRDTDRGSGIENAKVSKINFEPVLVETFYYELSLWVSATSPCLCHSFA